MKEKKTDSSKCKGIIFYYSGSGNTKLACQYIIQNLNQIDVELFNMVKAASVPDLTAYDLVGFATFTDFGGAPFLFHEFMKQLPQQNDKLAFVFNTFGSFSLKTLKSMAKLAKARGFKVVEGHSLHTPESYIPLIVKGRGAETRPDKKDMDRFHEFISELNRIVKKILEGEEIQEKKIKIGLLSSIIPTFDRTKARRDMGEKFVDEALCTECGICAKGCPYGAITLLPKPQFDMTKCYGCWYCYNHCPEKAIYTKKYRGVAHYPRPNDHLREKLKINS